MSGRWRSAWLAPALIATAAPAADASGLVDRYRVTVVGGGLGIEVNQAVLLSLAPGGRGGPRWIAERRRHDHDWCGDHTAGCVATDRDTHGWIDGRTCPALTVAMSALPAAVRADAAERASGEWVTASDTPELTLTALHPGEPGLPITGETVGAGARWWTRTEQAVAGCWTNEAPVIDGRSVPARLAG